MEELLYMKCIGERGGGGGAAWVSTKTKVITQANHKAQRTIFKMVLKVSLDIFLSPTNDMKVCVKGTLNNHVCFTKIIIHWLMTRLQVQQYTYKHHILWQPIRVEWFKAVIELEMVVTKCSVCKCLAYHYRWTIIVFNHLRTQTIVQYSSHTSFITGIMTSACFFSHIGKVETTLETMLRATKRKFVTAPQKVLSREGGPIRSPMV